MVLLTCMTPVYWTFTFMVIDSFQYFRNEDLPNAIIHSVMALSKETFNLSVVRKGMLEMACNGRRNFSLVDIEAISDVAFGVFIIGGPVGKVLFLECRQTYFFGTQILKHIQLVDFIIHLYWVYGRACRILETPSAHHGG